jgi:cyclin H
MDFYEKSQHNTNCLYTVEQIAELRRIANNAAFERLKLPSELSPLSPSEEVLMLAHYRSKIPDICRYFKFPSTIAPTASWFLTRLSLQMSLVEEDPKHVMLSCILLASKCEGLHLTMEQYAPKIPNTNAETLLRLEFVLLRILEYRVHFFHPAEALAGFLVDYKGWSGERWKKSMPEEARNILNRICGTDALLIYSPARLAAIALFLTHQPSVSEYLQERLPVTRVLLSSNDPFEVSISIIEGMLDEKIDPEEIRSIDRRILQIRKLFHS